MNVSPHAGQPAELSMLVNVPRLVTAYYTQVPDPSVPSNGSRSAPQDIAVPHSTRPSTSGISWPSVRPFACIGNSRRSMARCFSAWTPMRSPCRLAQRARSAGGQRRGRHARRGRRIHADSCGVSRDSRLQPRAHDRTRRWHRHHAFAQSARRRRFQIQPAQRRTGGDDVTGWIEARANEFLERRLAGVKRIPFEKALRASTTHRHDYLTAYVSDLASVIDMDVIRGAKISMGVDPLGGAGVHYWGSIAERYGLNLTVVNEDVDPTFRFMTVDWDGRIRMDPSSPYAMQRLIGMKDRFDIAFACDTDHDRHGIVTRSGGLAAAQSLSLGGHPLPLSTSAAMAQGQRPWAKPW